MFGIQLIEYIFQSSQMLLAPAIANATNANSITDAMLVNDLMLYLAVEKNREIIKSIEIASSIWWI